MGDPKAEHARGNGTGRIDSGTIEPRAPDSPSLFHGSRARRGRCRPFLEVLSRHSESAARLPLRSDGHLVAGEMLANVLATPTVISPEERYLCGHYLAYLLGGSRRRGIFLRRPLDARNADRGRLLLAMAWLSCVGPTDEFIKRASVLLDERPDVRAALSPAVVVKYLASRDRPRQAPVVPPGPPAAQGSQHLRAQVDARLQGHSQPRHDAPDSQRSGADRPTPRQAGRPPCIPLEPRRGNLAPGRTISARRSFATPRDLTTATRSASISGRKSSIP